MEIEYESQVNQAPEAMGNDPAPVGQAQLKKFTRVLDSTSPARS